MATISLFRARPAKTISGNSPKEDYYPEAASQTFKKGEFVYLVAGKVTIIPSTTPSLVLGMAQADASGVTDTPVPVAIANTDTIFEANYSNGSQAGAVSTVASVGTRHVFDLDATNHRVYISSSTTSPRVIIHMLSEKDAAGDTGGRVLFQVMSVYRQLETTS